MAETLGLIPVKDKVNELARFYSNAGIVIERDLFLINMGNYSTFKSMQVRDKIEKFIRGVNIWIYKWASRSVKNSYTLANKKTVSQLGKIGKEKSRFNEIVYGRVNHQQYIQDYIDLTAADFIRANKGVMLTVNLYLDTLRRTQDKVAGKIQEFVAQDFQDEIDDIVEAGLIPTTRVTKDGFKYVASKSRWEIKQEIIELFRENFGDLSFIQITGKDGVTRHYDFKSYSEMVARTRLRQAQTAAIKNTCAEYDQDLVEWSSHFNPCPRCEPFEGQVSSLSGKSPFYPPLTDEPPIHPNCEHNIYPVSEAELSMSVA